MKPPPTTKQDSAREDRERREREIDSPLIEGAEIRREDRVPAYERAATRRYRKQNDDAPVKPLASGGRDKRVPGTEKKGIA